MSTDEKLFELAKAAMGDIEELGANLKATCESVEKMGRAMLMDFDDLEALEARVMRLEDALLTIPMDHWARKQVAEILGKPYI